MLRYQFVLIGLPTLLARVVDYTPIISGHDSTLLNSVFVQAHFLSDLHMQAHSYFSDARV